MNNIHTDDEAISFKQDEEDRERHGNRMSLKNAVGKARNISKTANLFMAQKDNLIGLKHLDNQIEHKLEKVPTNAEEFRKEAIRKEREARTELKKYVKDKFERNR